jgi:hypothetical protein
MAKKAKDRRSAASSARSQAAGLSFLTKKFRCYSNTPPSSESWSPSRISAPATEPAEAELPGVLAWMAAAVGLLLAGWRAQTGWWVPLPSLGAALELCSYDGSGDGAHMATTAAATAPATHTHARTHAHTHTHTTNTPTHARIGCCQHRWCGSQRSSSTHPLLNGDDKLEEMKRNFVRRRVGLISQQGQ